MKPEAKVVALLHDVLEDTRVTGEELRKLFPETVVRAVELLTKEKGKGFSLERIWRRSGENELACCVKDRRILEHNTELSRIPDPKERDYRRVEQYQKAKEYLEGKKKEK